MIDARLPSSVRGQGALPFSSIMMMIARSTLAGLFVFAVVSAGLPAGTAEAATRVSIGASSLNGFAPIAGAGGQLARGELYMVTWQAATGYRVGFMVEQVRAPIVFGIVGGLETIGLLVERDLSKRSVIGLGAGKMTPTGGFAGAIPAGFIPAFDLHGRTEIRQFGRASLGVLLGARYFGGVGAGTWTAPFVRMALIGTAIL